MGALLIPILLVLGCSEQFSKLSWHVGRVPHLSSAVLRGMWKGEFAKIVFGRWLLTGMSYGPGVDASELHFLCSLQGCPTWACSA